MAFHQPEPVPDFIPPSISDTRYGWGLSPEALQKELTRDPDWEYFSSDANQEGELIVVYKNKTHGYCHCWDFDKAGNMQQVRLLILPDMTYLVGAFLLGSTWFGDSWIYVQELLEHPEAAPQVYVHEFEQMTVLRIVFHNPQASRSVE